jgi:transcriptional regulator with XRE-family HTH domain
MDWSAEEVRQLRYRLGWSQAEMARCLKLELATLSSVETGQTPLPESLSSELIRILYQADSNAERVQRRPIAEVMMRDRHLCQIHDLEVVESIIEPKL